MGTACLPFFVFAGFWSDIPAQPECLTRHRPPAPFQRSCGSSEPWAPPPTPPAQPPIQDTCGWLGRGNGLAKAAKFGEANFAQDSQRLVQSLVGVTVGWIGAIPAQTPGVLSIHVTAVSPLRYRGRRRGGSPWRPTMFMRTKRLFLRPIWPEDWTALADGMADDAVDPDIAAAPPACVSGDARTVVAAQHDP